MDAICRTRRTPPMACNCTRLRGKTPALLGLLSLSTAACPDTGGAGSPGDSSAEPADVAFDYSLDVQIDAEMPCFAIQLTCTERAYDEARRLESVRQDSGCDGSFEVVTEEHAYDSDGREVWSRVVSPSWGISVCQALAYDERGRPQSREIDAHCDGVVESCIAISTSDDYAAWTVPSPSPAPERAAPSVGPNVAACTGVLNELDDLGCDGTPDLCRKTTCGGVDEPTRNQVLPGCLGDDTEWLSCGDTEFTADGLPAALASCLFGFDERFVGAKQYLTDCTDGGGIHGLETCATAIAGCTEWTWDDSAHLTRTFRDPGCGDAPRAQFQLLGTCTCFTWDDSGRLGRADHHNRVAASSELSWLFPFDCGACPADRSRAQQAGFDECVSYEYGEDSTRYVAMHDESCDGLVDRCVVHQHDDAGRPWRTRETSPCAEELLPCPDVSPGSP
jgi:hypothetical protein